MAFLAVVEGGAAGWRIDRDALTDTIRAARVLLPPPSTNGAVAAACGVGEVGPGDTGRYG
ncbi:hypothetical protein ACIG54_36415 [Streptomyces achromogenes]|uniref:hypothetical protein n=1 Tax=Streptomyces achromogenes TaxID=67255 RepID=UPI0037CF3F95